MTQERYGESILVERRLTDDGGSVFKLKNARTGQTVSSRRSDLDDLADAFSIQVVVNSFP